MKNLIFVLLALSSLIMVSCANADSLVGSTTLFDYNRSNHQVVDSSFLSGLSVVELEQTPTGPVVEIDRMIEIDGNLCVFFQSQGKVAMFDGKGKFLREICRRGKGHGEYTQLVDVAYDKYNDEFLFLVAPSSIMRYSKTGIFKDKKELDKLYSEIAVDSSFIYLYNPTYTKDAKMDYTIECINKKNGERKQLLEMNEDYSPYSSVGFRMFATKQGVSFVRKFDNCIYDIKNGELKHLSHIDLKGCAYNNKSGDDLSTVELTNECWREKKIYSFANVARSNDYLIFSSNLWDVNICDLKKNQCSSFSKMLVSEYDINLLSFVPVGNSSKVCFYLEGSRIEQTKDAFLKNPEIGRTFSGKFRELITHHKDDTPVLFIYDLK